MCVYTLFLLVVNFYLFTYIYIYIVNLEENIILLDQLGKFTTRIRPDLNGMNIMEEENNNLEEKNSTQNEQEEEKEEEETKQETDASSSINSNTCAEAPSVENVCFI